MDEFKHGDCAEEGWRRVNEYLRREDNSLCANLKKKKLFMLPAEENQGKCRDERNRWNIQTSVLTHTCAAVVLVLRINCKCTKCWCAAVT